jgi:hypothetical protein
MRDRRGGIFGDARNLGLLQRFDDTASPDRAASIVSRRSSRRLRLFQIERPTRESIDRLRESVALGDRERAPSYSESFPFEA